MSTVNLSVYPKRFVRILLLAVAALAAAHVAGVVSRFYLDHDHVFGLIRLFDLDQERNIPTLFTTGILSLSVLLFAIIAAVQRRTRASYPYHWGGLAIIFAFLAADESWSMHERLISPLRQAFGAGGLFYFSWIVPYGIAVAVIGLSYLRFLANLPRPIRVLLLIAGFVYLSGAIGFEMVGGYHAQQLGQNRPTYAMLILLEETLEMLGIVILIHALFLFMGSQYGELRLSFAPAGESVRSKLPPVLELPPVDARQQAVGAPERRESSGRR